MLAHVSIQRVNRFATLSILPMMLVAIAVFSRMVDRTPTADAPTEGTVIVANLRTETLTFIDLGRDQRAELALPGPPHELLVESGRLYVTLGRGNAVVEVDLTAHAVLRTLRLEGEPHGLATLGGNLYVTLDKGNEVVIIDRASMTEIRRVPTGNTPHVIAATGSAIIVTDSRDNVLRQLEPSAVTAPTGAQPEGIAIVDGVVVSADAVDGTLTFATVPGLTEAKTMRIGDAPVRVVPLSEGRAIVSLQGDGRVAVIDVAGASVRKRLAVAERPDGLCPSPDGEYFAVASNASGLMEFFADKSWGKAPAIELARGLGACAWVR